MVHHGHHTDLDDHHPSCNYTSDEPIIVEYIYYHNSSIEYESGLQTLTYAISRGVYLAYFHRLCKFLGPRCPQ